MNRFFRPTFFGMTFLIVFGFQVSCVDHDFPSYTCPDSDVSYLEDVKPIVESKCALSGCHNGSLGEDRNWTNFEVFQRNAKTGNVKNYVINRIMPPSGSPAGAARSGLAELLVPRAAEPR